MLFRSGRLYGGAEHVDERHRHRYEVNPELIEQIEDAGLKYVGKDETGQRCEIMELGPYHGGMRSNVIVDEQEEFDTWLTENSKESI